MAAIATDPNYRGRMATVKWLEKPEEHDFPAAADYLALLAGPDTVAALTQQLRAGTVVHKKAKDILRAAQLSLLPTDNPPIPLVRGGLRDRRAVADRRRLPPGVRELSHRREHWHSGDSGRMVKCLL